MEGSGFLFLLEHARFDDLRRMHRLFAAAKAPIPWKSSREWRGPPAPL